MVGSRPATTTTPHTSFKNALSTRQVYYHTWAQDTLSSRQVYSHTWAQHTLSTHQVLYHTYADPSSAQVSPHPKAPHCRFRNDYAQASRQETRHACCGR